MARTLSASFFARDPRRVARELLGKLLMRQRGRNLLIGRIVEVEAYLDSGDAAAHAAAGITQRNRVLFGPPGRAYVYFIYGNHYCLNVSCQPAGEAGCVLIRALEPLAGLAQMARARSLHLGDARFESPAPPTILRQLTSGPGRLCEAFGITRARDNGGTLTSHSSRLRLADDGYRPPHILTTPRIGIRKDAGKRLRFVIAGNPFVSGKWLAQ
ncbi:MAG: DNA-3-methyladenine glycosylase [Terriglobales bacterium]